MRRLVIRVRPLAALSALCVVGALAACGQNRAAPPAGPLKPEWYAIAETDRPAPGQFLRYAPPGPNGGGLDIAITDYAPPAEGATIRLVGVVHVADAPYYEKVQQELDDADVVLYEGVKPSEMDGLHWQKSMLDATGEMGTMQKEIAQWFGFRYQMAAIDYGRPNLVHADMSLDEFAAAGGERMGLVPRKPAPGSNALDEKGASGEKSVPNDVLATWSSVRGLAEAALGEDGPLRSLGRRMFAQTMGTADIGTSLDFVPGLSELLLNKRNAVVMKTLEAERSRPSGVVAIFYGAAHMKDLSARLEALGYRRTGGRWLRAWALRPPLD